MTDRDWEVDGADGGSAGAVSGAEARPAQSQRPANVVPFPGNWFGSVDELVPVHSEPEPVAVHPDPDLGSVAPEPARMVPPLADLPGVFGGPMKGPAVATPPAEPPAGSAADASDFWEGDAAALTEVPAATESPSSIALLRSPGAAKRKPPAEVADESYRSGDSAGGVATDRRAPRRTRRAVVVAAALAVAAAAGALLLLMPHLLPRAPGSGASHRHTSLAATAARNSPLVVTQTQTITSAAVTVTTRQRARHHRHHVPKARVGGTPSRSASSSGSVAHPSASDTVPAQGATTPTSPPVVVSNHSSGTGSAASGTTCAAQSPDSGCLP